MLFQLEHKSSFSNIVKMYTQLNFIIVKPSDLLKYFIMECSGFKFKLFMHWVVSRQGVSRDDSCLQQEFKVLSSFEPTQFAINCNVILVTMWQRTNLDINSIACPKYETTLLHSLSQYLFGYSFQFVVFIKIHPYQILSDTLKNDFSKENVFCFITESVRAHINDGHVRM